LFIKSTAKRGHRLANAIPPARVPTSDIDFGTELTAVTISMHQTRSMTTSFSIFPTGGIADHDSRAVASCGVELIEMKRNAARRPH
jgi:hypothetical protein